MAGELIFEARKLTKKFGAVTALDEVDFQVRRGEITGLIGENGSGKSTITSIAAGMQPATKGDMLWKGLPHRPASVLEGSEAGIGMVVQEQGTVMGLSIAHNIFLGRQKQFGKVFVNKKAMYAAAHEALELVGFGHLDPAMPIDSLNLQDRKLVEIAKVMYAKPEMLVVDETTTALSQSGRAIIYNIMEQMKRENKAVVFISHDLDELMKTCDALTVLRDGKLIKTLTKEEMAEDIIKKYMVGRNMTGDYYRGDWDSTYSEEVVLKADHISTGRGNLVNFSMELHKGEILGIGGLSHCGMHELGRTLFGEEKLLTGKVVHCRTGDQITNPREALLHGMGYMSKDRDKEALIMEESISDNIMAAGTDKVTKGILMRPGKVKSYVGELINLLSIKCAGAKQDVQYLSGGNKQKVAFGKWYGRDCDILIMDCPTRGVDIGVKADMYRLINEMKQAGKSIVMISEEMTELIGMADRLLILKDGSVSGEFMRSKDLSEHMIIDVMI